MKSLLRPIALVAVLLILGCRAPDYNTVSQVSTIDSLLAGVYDGQMTCGELLTRGDFGIGTFHRLDGEMVVLEGRVYQVKADGSVVTPDRSMTTPFASVVRFKPDIVMQASGELDMAAFEKLVDEAVPNANIFCAVKADGHFERVKVRSVPAQNRPYPPLVEVTRNQPVFEYDNVDGYLVGFRLPSYVKGVNVPGYHLHFLSTDRTKGGHVLEFTMAKGTIEADVCGRFFMILPESSEDFGRLDLGKDRSEELERVEK